MPGINLHTFKGLVLMEKQFPDGLCNEPLPVKDQFRVNQVRKLFTAMRRSHEKVCLLVIGSNDFKSFIVKNNKDVLGAGSSLKKKWPYIPTKHKIKFNIKKYRLVSRTVSLYIESQVEAYLNIIKDVVQGCRFETVIISSLLERNWDKIGYTNLDFWFSHINSLLYYAIAKIKDSVLNVNGKPIVWKTVNVSKQYFEAQANDNVKGIFRHSEQVSGKMTHRSMAALKEIVSVYMEEIDKYV